MILIITDENFFFKRRLAIRKLTVVVAISSGGASSTVVSIDASNKVSISGTHNEHSEPKLMYGDIEGSPPRKKQAMDPDLHTVSYEDTPSTSVIFQPAVEVVAARVPSPIASVSQILVSSHTVLL
ncbi:hypothetical protein NQ317_016278 [Molorchus minor]|uniref:Uncharacterized protein n=1 Tax=Molorchus minor TaxID=1323400 RepID=A0ABQ9JXT9_9CUCU|nr:hypothetical protein NQ317_016278 [Molorchus minor]